MRVYRYDSTNNREREMMCRKKLPEFKHAGPVEDIIPDPVDQSNANEQTKKKYPKAFVEHYQSVSDESIIKFDCINSIFY